MSTHLPHPPPDDDAEFIPPGDAKPPRDTTRNDPPNDKRRGAKSEQEPYDSTGVTALVCGIAGFVLSMIPIMNLVTWPLAALAIIFGGIGWNRSIKDPNINRKFAIAAVALGVAALFITCGVYAGADPTNEIGARGL